MLCCHMFLLHDVFDNDHQTYRILFGILADTCFHFQFLSFLKYENMSCKDFKKMLTRQQQFTMPKFTFILSNLLVGVLGP